MKKLIIIAIVILSGTQLFAQQMPISENYFMDKYSLAPSYAGNFNSKYLFMGYRSDWSGIDGGPKTFRLSYNDSFMENAGYGGKLVYDKSGIFKQFIIMGSYSYKAKVTDQQYFLFGLSAGFYKNTINFSDYYNDPKYNLDPTLINADINSRLKFMSDFSVVYALKDLEAGFLFSNINFGEVKYSTSDYKFKPLANFQFHTSYRYDISENWEVSPIVVIRGGRYIKSQFEIASQVVYMKRIFGSLLYRGPGIWGMGLGANINNMLKFGYNFNIGSSTSARIYNNHEITIGVNIFGKSTKQRGIMKGTSAEGDTLKEN